MNCRLEENQAFAGRASHLERKISAAMIAIVPSNTKTPCSLHRLGKSQMSFSVKRESSSEIVIAKLVANECQPPSVAISFTAETS